MTTKGLNAIKGQAVKCLLFAGEGEVFRSFTQVKVQILYKVIFLLYNPTSLDLKQLSKYNHVRSFFRGTTQLSEISK